MLFSDGVAISGQLIAQQQGAPGEAGLRMPPLLLNNGSSQTGADAVAPASTTAQSSVGFKLPAATSSRGFQATTGAVAAEEEQATADFPQTFPTPRRFPRKVPMPREPWRDQWVTETGDQQQRIVQSFDKHQSEGRSQRYPTIQEYLEGKHQRR